MRKVKSVVLLASVLFATPVLAGPHLVDCDAEKAAKNAAMKATVGVHGACDPEKLADQKKDDAKDHMDDAKDDVSDRKDDLRDKNDDRDHKLKRD